MSDFGKGHKYQLRTAMYLASCLSQNKTVKDYYIFWEVWKFRPLDDIVLAVQFKGSEDFRLYLIQVKSGRDSFTINKYLEEYNNMKKEKKWEFFKDIGTINKENIQCWYFACRKLPNSQQFEEDSEIKQLELKERQSDGSVSIIDKTYNKNYKLHLKGDNTTTKHQDFFDNFYIYQAQPNLQQFLGILRHKWQLKEPEDVINYLNRYLIESKNPYVSKTLLEYEVLKIRLSDCIVMPVDVIPIEEESAKAWINLTLLHNITVIQNTAHTKSCLFGCILQTIGTITVKEWNECVSKQDKLSDTVRKKFSSKKFKPDTLKDLLIHFWMSNKIPLILESAGDLPILSEFSAMKQHYVISDGKLKKRYNEMKSYNLSVIKDLGGQQVDELLQSIQVSLQGRKSTSLYEVINGDETLLETLTCSDILKLIEPKQVYLNDKCFKDGTDMLFLIESGDTEEFNEDNYIIIGDNILMYCPVNQSGICYEKVVHNPKFKNCKIYRLYSQTSENSEQKLSLTNESKSNETEFDEALSTSQSNSTNQHAGLEYFFIDQHGDSVYWENKDKVVPIVGEMMNMSCPKYLTRRMRKGIIKSGENGSSPDDNRNPVVEYTESSFWENDFFIETNRKICVVTGEPGIGKSTFLRSLIHICQPLNYVLFCDLARYETDLHDKSKKQSELCRDPLNFLRNKHNSLPYSEFLSTLKKDARRLIIVLDSVDEVVATCKENVLKLINKLNEEPRLGKIIIGSRLLTANLLNNKFDVDLVEIAGLNKEWNHDYIQNWNIDENHLRNVPAEFVKNPLYLNLLRTIAESNINMESLNRWTLYKTILDFNIDLYYKRRKQNPDDFDTNNISKYCYALAFRAFLPYNRITRKLAENTKEVYTNFARIGIIKCFNKKGVPVFVHRTFLEFLISRWLIETSDKEDAKHVYEYLIRNRMHDILYIHSEQFRLHKAVIGRELTEVQNLCDDDSELLKETDKLERTALHIAAIELLIFKTNAKITEVILQNTVEKNFNLYPCDKLLNWTWIDYYHKYLYRNIYNCDLLSDTILEAYWNYQYQIRNESFWKFMSEDQFDMFFLAALLIPSINIMRILFLLKYYNNEDLMQIEELSSRPEVTVAALPESAIPGLETTLMHFGCIYSNLNVVRACIERGDDINATDRFGYTPLYYGVCSQQSEIVELLLEKRVDTELNPTDQDLAGLLGMSLRIKNKNILTMLIKAMSESLRDCDWSCILHDVVNDGIIEAIEMLLEAGVNVNIHDEGGDSLLHLAVQLRMKDLVQLLAQYEINVNMTNISGETALFVASRSHDAELIEMLLNLGADINIAAENGDTVLSIAVKDSYSKDDFQLLVQHGADVNCKNRIGETPLFGAVKTNNRQKMEILLNAGANVNIQDENGNTALHIATNKAKCNTQMVEMLLNTNINVNIANASGDTPLHNASCVGDEDTVRLLLQHQANVSVTNCRQETPLLLAVGNEKIAIINILLNEDVNLNTEARNGDTPLSCAIRNENVEIVKILLENGADANYVDKYGSHLTPLLIAVETQNLEITKILLFKGADVNFKSEFDVTPLYVGVLLRNVNLVKLLLEHEPHLNIFTSISAILIKAKERGDISTALWLLNYWAKRSTNPINDETFSDEVKHFIQTVENGDDINLVDKILLNREGNNTELAHELLNLAADVTNPTPIGIKCLEGVRELNDQEVDRILLDNFRNKYRESIEKFTDVGYAAVEGNRVLVKILLRNIQKTDYSFPMRVIRYSRNKYSVEILLENQVDVNLPDEDGDTPLIVAVRYSTPDVIELLLENGAAINGVGSEGSHRTALFVAVTEGNQENVRLLLQKGAHIHLKPESLLCTAVKANNVEIVHVLLENGADPNERDQDGWSALHFAVRWSCKDIVKKLLEFKADVNIRNNEGFIPLDYVNDNEYKSDIVRMLRKREAGVDNLDDSDDEGDYNE